MRPHSDRKAALFMTSASVTPYFAVRIVK